jgi:hypothetical protein
MVVVARPLDSEVTMDVEHFAADPKTLAMMTTRERFVNERVEDVLDQNLT